MTPELAYTLVRRSLLDAAFVERYRANAAAALIEQGVTAPEEINELSSIINLLLTGASQQSAMARKMEEQGNETLAVAGEMKRGLKRTLDQIDEAYRSTMRMYVISFYLGVLLILTAIGAALLSKEALLPAVFGSLGTIDLLVFFLVKPQERLQASRASLAQVQAALYNWFIDSVNLNTLMGAHHQQGDLKSAAGVSETLLAHTDKTLEMLQKYGKIVGS